MQACYLISTTGSKMGMWEGCQCKSSKSEEIGSSFPLKGRNKPGGNAEHTWHALLSSVEVNIPSPVCPGRGSSGDETPKSLHFGRLEFKALHHNGRGDGEQNSQTPKFSQQSDSTSCSTHPAWIWQPLVGALCQPSAVYEKLKIRWANLPSVD